MKILVVDDEAPIRELLSFNLKKNENGKPGGNLQIQGSLLYDKWCFAVSLDVGCGKKQRKERRREKKREHKGAEIAYRSAEIQRRFCGIGKSGAACENGSSARGEANFM